MSPYKTKFGRYISDRILPRINRCGDDLNVGISLKEARERSAIILKGKIIVGHSVFGDLAAVGVSDHPPEKVRDTAVYAPFLTVNGRSHKLSYLAKERLGRVIQHPGRYHCCKEDALATLDLYKSAWVNFESCAAELAREGVDELSSRAETALQTTAVILEETAPIEHSRNNKRVIRKGKKRARRKLKQERNRSRFEAGHHAVLPLSTKHTTTSSRLAFFQMYAQDLISLIGDFFILFWRVMRLRIGPRPKPRQFKRFRRMGKKMKLLKQLSFCDSFMLLSHIYLIAFVNIVTLMYFPIRREGEIAFSVARISTILVGVSLFVAKNNRCTLQSRICFALLAQYHFSIISSDVFGENSSADDIVHFGKLLLSKNANALNRASAGPFLSDCSVYSIPFNACYGVMWDEDFPSKISLLSHSIFGFWFMSRSFLNSYYFKKSSFV